MCIFYIPCSFKFNKFQLCMNHLNSDIYCYICIAFVALVMELKALSKNNIDSINNKFETFIAIT